MSGLEIKRVRPSDWSDLRRVRLLALRSDPDAYGSSLALEGPKDSAYWQDWADRASRSADLVTLLGYQADRPIAIGGGIRRGEEVEIVAMWVGPDARRQGIGKALIRSIESHFENADFSLWVHVANPAAIALYEKNGYRDGKVREALERDPRIIEMKMVKPHAGAHR